MFAGAGGVEAGSSGRVGYGLDADALLLSHGMAAAGNRDRFVFSDLLSALRPPPAAGHPPGQAAAGCHEVPTSSTPAWLTAAAGPGTFYCEDAFVGPAGVGPCWPGVPGPDGAPRHRRATAAAASESSAPRTQPSL